MLVRAERALVRLLRESFHTHPPGLAGFEREQSLHPRFRERRMRRIKEGIEHRERVHNGDDSVMRGEPLQVGDRPFAKLHAETTEGRTASSPGSESKSHAPDNRVKFSILKLTPACHVKLTPACHCP